MAFEGKESTEVFENTSESNDFISIPGTVNREAPKQALDCNSKTPISGLCRSKQLRLNDGSLNVGRLITDLPPVLISEILNFLDLKELGVVSCVSTTLRNMVYELNVWKELYCERWGLPVVSALFGLEKSWKKLFVERELRSKKFLGRYRFNEFSSHTDYVTAVCLLASAKLIISAGEDCVLRMWDMEKGLCIASSQKLGSGSCYTLSLAADTNLLVAGGDYGCIYCWKAVESLHHLFDLQGVERKNSKFQLEGHEKPVVSLALDLTRIYSGSRDKTVRVWDRSSLTCTQVLRHDNCVQNLVLHGTNVVCTSGTDMYVWETNTGKVLNVIHRVHSGNIQALAGTPTGDFFFTGGYDREIQMFQIMVESEELSVVRLATWTLDACIYGSHINSLAFEFPWLVSASPTRISLIDVQMFLSARKPSLGKGISMYKGIARKSIERPQRVLRRSEGVFFKVNIVSDRIVCAGGGGLIRTWKFPQALETRQRVSAQRRKR